MRVTGSENKTSCLSRRTFFFSSLPKLRGFRRAYSGAHQCTYRTSQAGSEPWPAARTMHPSWPRHSSVRGWRSPLPPPRSFSANVGLAWVAASARFLIDAISHTLRYNGAHSCGQECHARALWLCLADAAGSWSLGVEPFAAVLFVCVCV